MRSVVGLSIAFCLAGAGPAFAYIDPNTGGLLMQILAPIFLAIAVFFQRIKLLVRTGLARMKTVLARRRDGGPGPE